MGHSMSNQHKNHTPSGFPSNLMRVRHLYIEKLDHFLIRQLFLDLWSLESPDSVFLLMISVML